MPGFVHLSKRVDAFYASSKTPENHPMNGHETLISLTAPDGRYPENTPIYQAEIPDFVWAIYIIVKRGYIAFKRCYDESFHSCDVQMVNRRLVEAS